MILCNGSPKTGTNLLLRVVRLFDGHLFLGEHAHINYEKRIKGDLRKHIHITRNPRNVLISWMRANKIPLTTKNIKEEIPHTLKRMYDFIPWLAEPNILNVRFEELLTDPSVLKQIGGYINMPVSPNHFKDIWGGTLTFTGELSNWRDYWTPSIEKMWLKHNGNILETSLGYDQSKKYVRRCNDG